MNEANRKPVDNLGVDVILGRNSAMEHLQELRKNPGAIRKLDGVQLALSIPLFDYECLKVKYPILKYGSSHEKKRFWNRFLNTTEANKYRVAK